MSGPLVRDPNDIRLAMLGMVEGNGHPFSWSAIVNGRYDRDAMAACGYPVIAEYLGAQPAGALGIPGARVTHVWCDRDEDAERVARASHVSNVVRRAEDVIGNVDAAIVATDVGEEHLARARPFVEAGLPVFVDKPLTDDPAHLRQFAAWAVEGRAILSTSCMRYAREFAALATRLQEVGEPRLIVATMMKSWERYGIHALESVYGLLPPGGWRRVANTGTPDRNVVHVTHDSGVDVLLVVGADMAGGSGHVTVYGSAGRIDAQFADTFGAFKRQLAAFVEYLRTGRRPFPFEETVEQMKIIIGGIRSRAEGGRLIELAEVGA